MFSIPLVFLINSFIFILCTKERFKFYVTLSFAIVSFLISLIFNMSIVNFFDNLVDNSISAVGFNVVVLLIMSVFFSSNNIAQKILLALTIYFNFNIIILAVPEILSEIPLSTAGLMNFIVANGLYLLLALVTIAIFRGPMLHFFRNPTNFFSVSYCVIMFFAILNISGFICDLIKFEDFLIKFYSGTILYVLVLFIMRANYSVAITKDRDFKRHSTTMCIAFFFENINKMVYSSNSYRSIKNRLDHHFKSIYQIAKNSGDEPVQTYMKTSGCVKVLSPYVKTHCDDFYINAIISSKLDKVVGTNVEISSDLSVNNKDSRIKAIYAMISQMLEIGVDSALEYEGEDAKIFISSHVSSDSTTYDISFSQNQIVKEKFDIKKDIPEKIKAFFEKENLKAIGDRTIEIMLNNVFGSKKQVKETDFEFLQDIVKMLKGTMTMTNSSNKSNIKISLKN